MTLQRVICAGFGGQGVMSIGQLLSYAGMIEGKHVSWLPSYGPEMRGGTANCNVTVSATPIGSPIIAHNATAAIVMNLPSLIKFEAELENGGMMLINSSLIDRKPEREDIKSYCIPANEIAGEIGNSKVANMVMLGAYLELTKVVEVESVVEALKKVFGPSKEHLIPLNKEALQKGAEAVNA